MISEAQRKLVTQALWYGTAALECRKANDWEKYKADKEKMWELMEHMEQATVSFFINELNKEIDRMGFASI
jgi:hypothetical protein